MMNARRGSSDGRGRALGVLAGLTMLIALYMMAFYVPSDRVQGISQRIFYIHVPMAWDAFLAFFVVFIGGIMYLVRRSPGWDQLARAAAEIGLVFTSLVLITGSLWGKPIWGTWWSWDARMTSTLILWFIYLGYFMLRSYVGDRERAARYSAVLGIIGFVDVPIVYMSVNWWRTLHPQAVVNLSGAAMPASMLTTLMVSLLAFTILLGYLLYQKFRIEQAKDRVADLYYAREEAETLAAEGAVR
ncbi:cytochrome c biogenesis protein CcsA [Nitrolancea hollandica]|uniref:cytochrome c biogenesis protein CcsA n=1 Tax=Nitrolancea hollandica TaxID=1206749 RepID=UPI0002F8BA19|nr:cytochrome c biogenesis protein CcsA [Nitrolancea hollandica]